MTDKLAFPVDNYSLKSKEVETSGINRTLTYKEYKNITYCANPVDSDFEGMDVFVPVSVDENNIEVIDAPILIDNYIQAYTSYNIRTGIPGMPHPEMTPNRPNMSGGSESSKGHEGPPDDARHPEYERDYYTYYALTRGIVVVRPGARGRENQFPDGTYYGKAPAVLVDLKALVRYIKHNKSVFPGNTDKIFSCGGSAGGAISAALGASGDYKDFEPYLDEIGSAEESDAILGTICYCPILDLEHSDAAYEWMFGKYPGKNGLVDQEKSAILAGIYADYLKELDLQGRGGFGTLTADNIGDYIVKEYMSESAEHYLNDELTSEERDKYLSENPWITWDGCHATFTFSDLTAHIGRMKGLCSFDGRGEMSIFGNKWIDERHFTDFGAKEDDPNGIVDPEVRHIVDLMNPMFYILNDNPGSSKHWYIVVGSKDSSTSHSVTVLFNTLLENKNMDTNLKYLWDFGHQCKNDPIEMVDWIMRVSDEK